MVHKLIVALCIAILVVSLPAIILGQQQQQPTSPSASPTSPKAPPSAAAMAQRDMSVPPSDAGGPPPDADAHSVDSNAPGQRYPRYKISADDVMELHFPLSPEYDQSVTVQPDGYISLIGANSIHLAGADTVFFLGLFFEASYASLVRRTSNCRTLLHRHRPGLHRVPSCHAMLAAEGSGLAAQNVRGIMGVCTHRPEFCNCVGLYPVTILDPSDRNRWLYLTCIASS